MNKVAVKEKINQLEVEIKLLRTAVKQRPDFDVDEKNWAKVRPALKKARARVAKEIYA